LLCDDPVWLSVGKDLFISVEQACSVLFSCNDFVPDFMSVISLTTLTATHKQAIIGESSIVLTFIPLSIFIGQLLLHLHVFDSMDQTHISLLASKYLECTLLDCDQRSFWHHSPRSVKGAMKSPFPIESRLSALDISLEDYEDSLHEKCEECYK
jgi:hypothetical protein